jgi:hypothetical protein
LILVENKNVAQVGGPVQAVVAEFKLEPADLHAGFGVVNGEEVVACGSRSARE